MCITILIIRLLTPYYGQKPKLLVHRPMPREIASINAFTLQIYLHAAIPDNAVILMIDAFYLIKHRLFLGIIIRLPVLQVVVISIRVSIKPSEKPANSQISLIFINESISL